MKEQSPIPPVAELISAYRELGSYKKVAERYGVSQTGKLMTVLRAAGATSPNWRSRPPVQNRRY